jgi:tetratricopeptide (TPR) repeat protein
VLIALDRGRPEDATAHLSALKGKLEPGMPELLEGRVRFALKDFASAVSAFRAAVAADPRRHDALLWVGVASAAKGDRAEAEQAGLKAAQAAPFHLVPDVPPGPLTVPAEELLVGAEGAFARLAKGPGDVMTPLLEGVVRFHQGDLSGAGRSLDSVLASDSGNVLARAYRSLVSLARHDVRAAVRDAERAVAAGWLFGLAHYARGVAQAAAGESEEAKRELLQAKALAPSLLAADYQLALLDEAHAPAAARDRLEGLLAIDPAFGPARRALYRLEKE